MLNLWFEILGFDNSIGADNIKLRMFGIRIDRPANLFGDNEAFYRNYMFSESQLRRKHQSICFHILRECVASVILIPHQVNTNYNLADLLTNPLSAVNRIALSS